LGLTFSYRLELPELLEILPRFVLCFAIDQENIGTFNLGAIVKENQSTGIMSMVASCQLPNNVSDFRWKF
jgi:hypothetical protein